MNEYRDIIPWLLAVVGPFIALKKDWIVSKFAKKEKELEVASSKESVESQQLDNVEKTMTIYRGIVDDLKKNINDLKSEIGELKEEVRELKSFIETQKLFIAKQSKSLEYYERKYGKDPGSKN